jgi:hypothetical protein
MKRFILLLAITTLALATLTGCGSDKKEGTTGMSITAIDGGYIGTATCLGCHDGSVATDRTSFLKSAHPYKYTHTGGAVMGTATLPGLFTRPVASTDYINTSSLNNLMVLDGTGRLDWSAINYTVGGFGWKIRWGVKDTLMSGGTTSTGFIWAGPKAQFNLWGVNDLGTGPLAMWSAYNSGNNKKYECAVCHNTNGIVSTTGYSCRTDGGTDVAPARTQPWAKNPGMGPQTRGGYYSSWTFDGVQCEACHGPGVGHATTNSKLGVLTLAGGVEICAKCHIRAENTTGAGAECGGDADSKILTNGAIASGDFIGHHESYNELVGYNGDGVHASLKCTTCHDPHKRSITVVANVASLIGITDNDLSARSRGAIKVNCVTSGCHGNKPNTKVPAHDNANMDCIDCHMAEANKSAISASTAGWGRKGDLKTHIFRINPAGTTITRTNADGKTIATNYLTPRYTCGKCHDPNIGTAPVYSGATSTLPADQEAYAQSVAAGYHQP